MTEAHLTGPDAERNRLDEADQGELPWRKWGPYLSERAWGTVREDYSPDGQAWSYLPFDQAGSRAYRWNEDGLAGVCDDQQVLCMGLALWNGRDPVLKERAFGLTGDEGNHGEDVKDYWWYLDATPTSSWLEWRYHYPQAEFPYDDLRATNRARTRLDPEYELLDTGVFDEDRYWAVTVRWAKEGPEDLLWSIEVHNAGRDTATIDVLPSIWYRNRWSWGGDTTPPTLTVGAGGGGDGAVSIHATGTELGDYELIGGAGPDGTGPEALFCDNETNLRKLFATAGPAYPKDGIDEHVRTGAATVNPARTGTKAALHHHLTVDPGGRVELRLRFRQTGPPPTAHTGGANPGSAQPASAKPAGADTAGANPAGADTVGANPAGADPAGADPAGADTAGAHPAGGAPRAIADPAGADTAGASPAGADLGQGFTDICDARRLEADAFFDELCPADATEEERRIVRQAAAGMLWSKQFFHYDVERWLDGDPGQPPPPEQRRSGRNAGWVHFNARDVMSMPDPWEYPWFAAWDLAFHCVALAHLDAEFAKRQLILLDREWYMHPNGQLPAYEWNFSDVNPPVQAWAALKVFEIDLENRRRHDPEAEPDLGFLERVFHKLLLNFTWWVNRKDASGSNVFEGGFLGLDNIGLFDRSKPLPIAGRLEQSDGTAWMAMYCLDLLRIALLLAGTNHAYEDVASKFFEHFTYIAAAMEEQGLWDESDGFFYDVISLPSGDRLPVKVRSMVGVVPLFAATLLDPNIDETMPAFTARVEWFTANKPAYGAHVAHMKVPGRGDSRLLSIVDRDRLVRVLAHCLDPDELLSDHGLRSLSRRHSDYPFTLDLGGVTASIDYEPAESTNYLFGGNSNWRGPVWMPLNYLAIESLRSYDRHFGDDLTVEYPTGSGTHVTLGAVADDIAARLVALWLPGPDGRRAVFGGVERLQSDPAWHDQLWFYEYFHGDNGAGLGASHQTGWTGLVLDLIVSRRTRDPAGA